jgi:hypothetical protein
MGFIFVIWLVVQMRQLYSLIELHGMVVCN